jgi:hypothetical protein
MEFLDKEGVGTVHVLVEGAKKEVFVIEKSRGWSRRGGAES